MRSFSFHLVYPSIYLTMRSVVCLCWHFSVLLNGAVGLVKTLHFHFFSFVFKYDFI